ncbi:MAG: hypothetical protein AAF727_12535 [Pseudomonadota bacterium]
MRWVWMIGVLVAGCGLVPTAEVAPVEPGAAVQPEGIQRPQARPDTLAAQPPAPDAVSVGTLGRTIASLGDAAQPGMWLKTPLVAATRQGRVFYPATDRSVEVTLIPIEGPPTAGSRMSLAAMQALGASPVDLIEVDVFGF